MCGNPPRHPARRVVDPFARAGVRSYLAGRLGDISAAVYDVDSGATYTYHPLAGEQTASIVKVDILATLLHERQTQGEQLTAAEEALAVPMIEVSDNDAALSLWNDEGGAPAVAGFDAVAGLHQTEPNTAGYFGLTWTTAPDQVKLLRCVMLPNDVLALPEREYEYELMLNVVPYERWGVSAGAAGDATVALKNGWLPMPGAGWQINSIGSIRGSGRRYLLAVLTSHDPSEGYGIETIEHVAASVWHWLDHPTARPRRRHR